MCLYQQKKVDPNVVSDEALDYMLELTKRNLDLRVKKKPIPNRNMEPISKGVFVMQVHAGVFHEGFVMFGCVIKNHYRQVITTSSRKEHIPVDPCVAKILTFRWSLLLA